jgi:MerR family copper efflux transcriptional regulator
MSDGALQIGEVARRVGLSLNTIRHWHDTGIAPPSGRSPGGFRLYTEADVARLAFIKRFRPLGFGIEEIREVLAARDALTTATPEDAASLVARLEHYIAIANERCAAIQDDLTNAQAFVNELSHDVASSRTREAGVLGHDVGVGPLT